jgi:hypothetical protein
MIANVELYSVGIAVLVSAIAAVLLILRLLTMVVDRGVDNLDPPPVIFATLMPLIRLVTFYITSNFPDKWLNEVEENLQKKRL